MLKLRRSFWSREFGVQSSESKSDVSSNSTLMDLVRPFIKHHSNYLLLNPLDLATKVFQHITQFPSEEKQTANSELLTLWTDKTCLVSTNSHLSSDIIVEKKNYQVTSSLVATLSNSADSGL